MPLILIDGMEDISSWVASSGGVTYPIGRHGRCVAVLGSVNFSFNLATADQYDILTVGFAVNFTALSSFAFSPVGFRSDAGATPHVNVQINTDYSIAVQRGGSTPLGTTAANIITPATWYYMEFSSRMHDTLGTFTLKINGATVLSGTGADTKNGGTKTVFDQVRISSQSGVTTQWDDLYVHGGTQDAFQGDIAVETLYPNGNGNANQWVGSDADSVNNYLLVNETGDPNTSNYTLSSTIGQQDMYALDNLVAPSGSILGVTHSAYAMKTDAGARDLKIVSRGSVDTKSAAVGLTTAYVGCYYTLANNPETSAAWAISEVNALQGGVETA